MVPPALRGGLTLCRSQLVLGRGQRLLSFSQRVLRVSQSDLQAITLGHRLLQLCLGRAQLNLEFLAVFLRGFGPIDRRLHRLVLPGQRRLRLAELGLHVRHPHLHRMEVRDHVWVDVFGAGHSTVHLAHPLARNRLVLDPIRTLSIVQRLLRLVRAQRRRRDGCNDAGLAAAAERLLQQPRQLRVPVRPAHTATCEPTHLKCSSHAMPVSVNSGEKLTRGRKPRRPCRRRPSAEARRPPGRA